MEKVESISKERPFEIGDFESIKKGILMEVEKMGERKDKEYSKIVSHLKRNPKIKSKRFEDALKDIFKLLD